MNLVRGALLATLGASLAGVLLAVSTADATVGPRSGPALPDDGPVSADGHASAGQDPRAKAAVPLAAPPAGYPVRGVDVSHHQGTINWKTVAASGQRFSYAKATEGVHFVDPSFAANNTGAKANGIYAGAYHFARPDHSTGRAQAGYFLDRAQYVADGRTLPPMLDVEWPWSGSGSPYPCYGLSPSRMVTWIRDFVTRVRERTGQPTMIYTNSNWWNPCTGNTSFGAEPLFHARYTSTPLPLPAGWSRWTIWQYTSSATVGGIGGRVDHDVFNGTAADLTALASGGTVRVGAAAGDATADGYADLVGAKPDGTVWLFPNKGAASPQAPYGAGRQVQTGWTAYDRTALGDVTGDRFADLLATRPDGSLWLFPNSAGEYPVGRQVGTGWNAFNRFVVGDVTADGYADIVATKADGTLWLYPNSADAFPVGRQVGTGWNGFDRIMLGDVTADRYTDLLATKADGTLWLYANKGAADQVKPYGSGREVGHGWNLFP